MNDGYDGPTMIEEQLAWEYEDCYPDQPTPERIAQIEAGGYDIGRPKAEPMRLPSWDDLMSGKVPTIARLAQ